MSHKWVGQVTADNGLTFVTVFDSHHAAVKHYWGEVGPLDWNVDVSGTMRYRDPESGYEYYVAEEPYYPDVEGEHNHVDALTLPDCKACQT